MKLDPYKKPRKIIYHKKYYMMEQRIDGLFKKLGITQIEQLDDEKYDQFLEEYSKTNPKYWDIIKGNYGFGLEKEMRVFFKRVFNRIQNERNRKRKQTPKTVNDL
jgi:hypothetical protein